ncbi:YwmB family TATA-box binding protein [Alkalibacillus haloalkaliphilus]|uniref:YwmB family TATA-box binding protein n=1 Tax=Alkalibacillus haloalkaliphilus TaxID=94136 RepID=UPI002935E469|nr:YwmB family TATA-box binding protein [Alkalibacillus haloalkaliphilus]MDV2583458.1 YwmB family TATA-box binding protein [Alkalibacillus haloalkaliphilus]
MRFLFVLLSVVLLSQVIIYQSSNQAATTSDFEVLADYVIEQDWDVHSFNVTMKLNGEKSEILSLKKVLNNEIKVKHPHKGGVYDETLYTVEVSHNTMQLVYRISGEQWSEHIYAEVLDRFDKLSLNQFFENGKVYSCYQSNLSGIIDSNLLLNDIKDDFQLELKNKMIEEQLSVFSGYTNQIEEYVPLEDEKMNVQLAIREEDHGKNTVTIGTPILLIEY